MSVSARMKPELPRTEERPCAECQHEQQCIAANQCMRLVMGRRRKPKIRNYKDYPDTGLPPTDKVA